jgi:hypothetical protein
MARTTFSGPVKSDNGFEGNVIGSVTGAVAGPVAATTLSASGAITLNGTSIIITGLPTADPLVAGQLWDDGGVLTVSAG